MRHRERRSSIHHTLNIIDLVIHRIRTCPGPARSGLVGRSQRTRRIAGRARPRRAIRVPSGELRLFRAWRRKFLVQIRLARAAIRLRGLVARRGDVVRDVVVGVCATVRRVVRAQELRRDVRADARLGDVRELHRRRRRRTERERVDAPVMRLLNLLRGVVLCGGDAVRPAAVPEDEEEDRKRGEHQERYAADHAANDRTNVV